MLPVALWSIKGQTHQNFECIVTDNSENPTHRAAHMKAVRQMEDSRFVYAATHDKIKVSDCYWSAEWAVENMASGTWLCFPCDDTYLVPDFGRRMLLEGYANGWDMVICGDVVVGPECNGHAGYVVWKMEPRKATKTTFIVRRSAFPGFTGKLNRAGSVLADYHLSGEVKPCGVLDGQIMVVHN